MKKKLTAAVAASTFIASLALTSCYKTKDWVCECTITAGGNSYRFRQPIENQSQKDAEAICKWYEQGDPNASCELGPEIK